MVAGPRLRGSGPAVLDDADTADRALVQQFPSIQQVCPFGELLLERDQYAQEILLIDRLIEVVAAEVDVVAATAELAVEIPQVQQVVRPSQDVRRIGRVG